MECVIQHPTRCPKISDMYLKSDASFHPQNSQYRHQSPIAENAVLPLFLTPSFHRIEIRTFSFQLDIAKILWPIAKSTIFI